MNLRALLSLCLFAVLLSGCEPKATEPGDDTNTPRQLTLNKQTDLPQTGGKVTAIDVSSGGVIAAIVDGRVCRVDPVAGTLTELTPSDSGYLAIDFGPGDILYALTNSALRTIDVNSGSVTERTVAGTLTEQIQIKATTNGDVYTAIINKFGYLELFRSTDQGMTWSQISITTNQGGGYLETAPSGDLYVAAGTGLQHSTDQGGSWTTVIGGSVNFIGTRAYATASGDVYYWAPMVRELKVSRSGGALSDLTFPTTLPAPYDIVESGGVLYATAQDAQVGSDAVPSGLLKSSDGGNTWTLIKLAMCDKIAAVNGTVIMGSTFDAGLFVSSNATNWKSVGRRTTENGIFDLALDKNSNIVISANGTVSRKLSSGWEMLANFGMRSPSIAASTQGAIACADAGMGLSVSTDNGITWKSSALPAMVSTQWQAQVSAFLYTKTGRLLLARVEYNNNVYVFANGRLHISDDNGTSFTEQGTYNFIHISADPTDGTLYGSTVNFNDNLRSITGGTTWDKYSWLGVGTPTAITNAGSAIVTAYSGMNYSDGSMNPAEQIEVTGSTEGYSARRVFFDSQDKMYFLTGHLSSYRNPDQGNLYISQTAFR